MNESIKLVSLMMLTAAIAGCGGGGGGGEDTSTAAPAPATASPGPSAPAAPPAPTLQSTGLGAPTLELSTSTNVQTLIGSLVTLAQKMADAQANADEAAAAQQLAKLSPGLSGGTSPFACPGGGSIAFSGSGGSLAYTYAGCSSGGYVFNGNAALSSLSAGGYKLDYNGVVAGGSNAPSGAVNGSSECTSGGNCVTTLANYRWGYDASFANGLANGTHQCTCANNRTWNVVFKDFGPTSGFAYVFATNGSAVATRTGPRSFSVQQTVNGVASQAVQFDLP